VLGAVLVVIAVTVSVRALKGHIPRNDDATVRTAMTSSDQKACDVFTLVDAKSLLGDTAAGGTNPIYEATNDISASSCTYSQDLGTNAPVASRRSATLLIRVPHTTKGSISNRTQFNLLESAAKSKVINYGSSAYWDSKHGELNILTANSSWLVISSGASSPAQRSLDDAKRLADIVLSKI